MRVPGLRHQAYFDRQLIEVLHLLPFFGEQPLYTQHHILTHGGVDIDRPDLEDGRELGRAGVTDQCADIDKVSRHDAIEGRSHLRVSKIYGCENLAGFRAIHGRLGLSSAVLASSICLCVVARLP